MKKISALILTLCAVGVATPAAVAQTYPTKPVRWVVPFPPGGGTDLISRTLAAKLSEAWGVQVVADNRPGGGGTIGMGIAAKTPPDGYTLVLGQASNVTVAPGLYDKIPYDPVKDLQPITQVISTPLVLVSHPSFPAKTAARTDRLCESEAGRGDLRLARQRHHRPPVGRNAEIDGRHQDAAHSRTRARRWRSPN